MEEKNIVITNDIMKHLTRCNKFLGWAKENGWTDDEIKRVIGELWYQYEMPFKQQYYQGGIR